jgi:hypothetical protein
MRALLIVVAMVAFGCRNPTLEGGRPPIGGRPGEGGRELPPGMRAGQSDLNSKIVKAKEDPNILVADDRTRCTVTEKRYRETTIGESVLCAWKATQ